MSSLAVIGTFYQRHENTPALVRAVLSSPRVSEFLVMCEGEDDAVIARTVDMHDPRISVHALPTPRLPDGKYAVIPYSNKINAALDMTSADYIVYLDNGSMPHPDKYEVMAAALDEHPDWGAVYCGQRRTGYVGDVYEHTRGVVSDAYCVLNYTQVMHRRTDDRWTLDMGHADPDLADALFWRSLHESLGPFYPVGEGLILDTHDMPGTKAVGL